MDGFSDFRTFGGTVLKKVFKSLLLFEQVLTFLCQMSKKFSYFDFFLQTSGKKACCFREGSKVSESEGSFGRDHKSQKVSLWILVASDPIKSLTKLDFFHIF